jgi:hypothetical protein
VTIAIRPSFGRETRQAIKVICPTAKAENFRRRAWTLRRFEKHGLICPSGKGAASPSIRPSHGSLLETIYFDHFYFETTDCAANCPRPPLTAENF